jgi:hypothetical protein
MYIATRAQELEYQVAFNLNPEVVKRFIAREQLPRSIAPFFRGRAGGEVLSGSGLSFLGAASPAEAGRASPAASPPSACTVVVTPQTLLPGGGGVQPVPTAQAVPLQGSGAQPLPHATLTQQQQQLGVPLLGVVPSEASASQTSSSELLAPTFSAFVTPPRPPPFAASFPSLSPYLSAAASGLPPPYGVPSQGPSWSVPSNAYDLLAAALGLAPFGPGAHAHSFAASGPSLPAHQRGDGKRRRGGGPHFKR